MSLDLSKIREEIDTTDKEIVELFEKRMKLCGDVAEYKISTGKKVLDKDRENEKIEKVKSLAHNDFNRHGVGELFSQIMSISRKMQYQILSEHGIGSNPGFKQVNDIEKKDVKVVYQGVPGAYSNKAMTDYFGKDVEHTNVKTFREAMEYVSEGRADYAVLPIENSTAGIINDTYDLLMEFNNYIVDQIDVKVEHALLGLPDAELSDIKTVYSHPQGLLQCRDFLAQYPNMKAEAYDSTSGSVKKVAKEKNATLAAIGSTRAASYYGLEVLRENINGESNNTTRFIVITQEKIYQKKGKKVSICFSIKHEAGSLYKMLSNFMYNHINLTQLESRPIKDRKWEYLFFLEFEGNLEDAAIQNALRGVKQEAETFYLLGCF